MLTTDPTNPALGRGQDTVHVGQNDIYLVLSDEELAKGYTRPYRDAYIHNTCGSITTMGHKLSATYARDPFFYGFTYCCACSMHKPVGEFRWTKDNEVVGS